MAPRRSAKPTSCVIYCRISKAVEGDTVKVERQERDCRKLAKSLGLTVARVYVDSDLSASNPKVRRPAFEDLLTSGAESIVVFHEDRLLRQTADLERVIELGVNIHSVLAGRLDLSTPTGRAVAKTVVAWAQYESEHKGERQRAANRDRAEAGKLWAGGTRCFGFTMDGTAIVEAEADRIRAAFTDVLAGRSIRSIATEWNRAGVRTTWGGDWSPRTLGLSLRRTQYGGRRSYHGVDVAAMELPAIVDPDTFAAVQVILSDPARAHAHAGRGPLYLLSTVARCGIEVDGQECGGLMTAGVGRSGSGHERNPISWRTVRCRETRHLERKAEPIEEFVTAVVLARLRRKDAAKLFRATAPDLGPLRTRAAALRAQRDTLAGDLEVDLSFAVKRDTRLRLELEAVEAEIAALSVGSALAVFADGQDPGAVWKGLEMDARRAVIRELMDVTVLRYGRRGRGDLAPFDTDTVRIDWRR